ncbi:hypothetical protein H0H93_010928, partial [Arthromyces matolae]
YCTEILNSRGHHSPIQYFMPITITTDPYKETPPDYMSDDHLSTRDLLIEQREGRTHSEAASMLLASWNTHLDVRKRAWDTERSDRESLLDSLMARDSVPAERRDTSVTSPTRPHTPPPTVTRERTSPKLSPGKLVPDFIDYPPSRFALKKLRELDFVELFYFTPEGRKDSAKTEHTNSDNGFTLAQVADIVTLKPAAQYKPSSRVIKDEDLSWEQLSLASTRLIEWIKKEGWPDAMTEQLQTFFYRLMNHEYREEEFGCRALVVYQARVRWEWHRLIKRKEEAFDISEFNPSLLRSIKEKLQDDERTRVLRSQLEALRDEYQRSSGRRKRERSFSPDEDQHYKRSRNDS